MLFRCLTNQWGQLKHKSIWNAHGAAGAMQCDCMGQKKNCWSLMLFSNTLAVAVSVAILGTNRYWTQLFRGKRSFIRSGRKFWVVFRKLMFKWNRGGVISAKCSSLHSIPFHHYHHHHHQWYWQFIVIIKINDNSSSTWNESDAGNICQVFHLTLFHFARFNFFNCSNWYILKRSEIDYIKGIHGSQICILAALCWTPLSFIA